MTKKIYILGGRGNGEFIAQIVDRIDGIELAGFVNDHNKVGICIGKFRKTPILLKTDELPGLIASDSSAHIISAYGGITNPKKVYKRLKDVCASIPAERWYNIIDKMAIVPFGYCKLGIDIFIGPFISICDNVTISNHCTLFSNSFVAHDAVIREFCRIAPGAVVGDGVEIGKCTHVGLNSVIREGIKVGEYSIIGAGAVVVKDVPPCSIVVGNPARIMKVREV